MLKISLLSLHLALGAVFAASLALATTGAQAHVKAEKPVEGKILGPTAVEDGFDWP